MVNVTHCERLDEDEWDVRFKVMNFGDGPLDLSTDIPCDTDPRCIWSVTLDDGDFIVITSGFRPANHYGYWITECPVPDGQRYEVHVHFEPT